MPKLPIFINVPIQMVETRIEMVVELGIGVELYAENNVMEDIPLTEATRIGKLLQDKGVPCTLHAPFWDLSPGGIDRKIRAFTKDKLKKAVEMARLLDAKGVVCHPGYDKWRFGGSIQERWLEASIDTWTEIAAEATGGPPVMLENVFEETPATFIALFNQLKGTELSFCFDTGHFNLFTTLPLDAWLIPLDDRLREIHLHDNHGGSDEHLPVGKGTFPFRELKAFLRHREDIIFTTEIPGEQYAMESIRCAREFLKHPA
jgi:sugar phosphate isomerase/epimerase